MAVHAISGLTVRETWSARNSRLEEFIGAEFRIDGAGALAMGEISAECSPTGMLFMKGIIEDPGQDHMVYVFDRGWPKLAFGIQNSGCIAQPVVLDIGDIADLKFKGRATSATGGVGPILVHEIVHTALSLLDPPPERQALEAGPTVEFVNLIRSERGLPLRNPYAEHPDGSFQDFTYVDENGRKVGRATANTSRLLDQGERYRSWCRKENRRAKAEGRVSQCRGSHRLLYENEPQ